MCCSFHIEYSNGKDGIILTDSSKTDDWLYRAVYERDRDRIMILLMI